MIRSSMPVIVDDADRIVIGTLVSVRRMLPAYKLGKSPPAAAGHADK